MFIVAFLKPTDQNGDRSFLKFVTVWIIDSGQETPRFVTAKPFLENEGYFNHD